MIVPVRVEISTRAALAGGGVDIVVQPVWASVDRPIVGGWALSDTPAHRRLAERLKRALLAGAVYSRTEVRTDVNGRTYVCSDSLVLGRHMNADLKRLGF